MNFLARGELPVVRGQPRDMHFAACAFLIIS